MIRLIALVLAILVQPVIVQTTTARTTIQPARIDRKALVSRHAVELTRIDPHAPMMVGNDNLGFTADITGTQTFADAYSPLVPMLTMAQWSWHSFPNPAGYAERDGWVDVPMPGGRTAPFPWIRDWKELETRPALKWLRENPHRFGMGRLSLVMKRSDGTDATLNDLTETRQKLDLWTGVLHSSFRLEGVLVRVETRVRADADTVLLKVSSPLVATGRVRISVRYPGVHPRINPDPQDWDNNDAHRTMAVERSAGHIIAERRLDGTSIWAGISAEGGRIDDGGAHRFIVSGSGDTVKVQMGFAPERAAIDIAKFDQAADMADRGWRSFWQSGGAIDFSGSTDPRASELERRIVLSQYLARINASGAYPPQEEGLFSNSWNGKFHLEVTPLHTAHWATWGRPDRLERTLGWYLDTLDEAKASARLRGVEGAWWTKMSGPNGWNSPSTINPFILWQQPHPIWMAELAYRARPDRAILLRYADLVEETAKLLASLPHRDAGGNLMLGPPVVPAQENHPPLTTTNPGFELEQFRFGLILAQQWRERLGQPRRADWDKVIADLPSPPMGDGLYVPVAPGAEDFWDITRSAECSRDAHPPKCLNRDHASFLMSLGPIPGRVDPLVMGRTLDAVERHWDLRQLWGWDFPIIAMTAARLGRPEAAIDWLFLDQKNNQWQVNGMTPRVHLEGETQLIGPAAAQAKAGPDGPGYRRAAETYFPSNGTLLLAVGMMAAGWEGSEGQAPGFPSEGWRVRTEGLTPLP
ncbi:hypothetical protein NYR55_04095 [Sphingomonas sp. BGYR3]|uniref:hypothetical protein n=1 Tax=Sphingomonas sp. BGYR3 TaxID=2975483 RepID=UPI0021A50B75|nr:hypothetical protein [Sphingomonas sp. BGYR3]